MFIFHMYCIYMYNIMNIHNVHVHVCVPDSDFYMYMYCILRGQSVFHSHCLCRISRGLMASLTSVKYQIFMTASSMTSFTTGTCVCVLGLEIVTVHVLTCVLRTALASISCACSLIKNIYVTILWEILL